MSLAIGPERDAILAEYQDASLALDDAYRLAVEEETAVAITARSTARSSEDRLAGERGHMDRMRQIEGQYQADLRALLTDRDARLRALDGEAMPMTPDQDRIADALRAIPIPDGVDGPILAPADIGDPTKGVKAT